MDATAYKESRRLAAANAATAMIEGSVGIIEGCRLLHSLSYDIVPDWRADEDFGLFGAVASETDVLPIGSVRQHWDALALEREDAKIAHAENLYREQVVAACAHLLGRLRDAHI